MGLDANIYISKTKIAGNGESAFTLEIADLHKEWWVQRLLEEIKRESCPYAEYWELKENDIDKLCEKAVDAVWESPRYTKGDVEDYTVMELFKAIGQAKLAFKNGFYVYYKADW